ncbi:hypothetical protein DFH08DRAFT_415014 [Mycena albidolilacea]|uniref:F-box domain-containing protein n=1 Tax=Mycena albidolilacea TaxID=1033008 RepID=A0AAD7EYU7_9AGAR|nr:hypothetical protein DFH08DRAFT_415014 [Mycena albidolilacea]
MSLLPQELLDAIIDQVRDKETLKACALVATSFLPASQRILFRKVRLGEFRRPRAALAEFPHLVSYIRDLTICTRGTVSEYLAVAVILRSVQSIESLAVFGGPGFRLWGRLRDEASSALLDCLSRPSLRRFELSHVAGVPAALILAATAIPIAEFKSVNVDVSMARLGEDISEQLHASAPVPRLRHLILGDIGPTICDFLLHPRKPSYTQQIERLEINIDKRSANYAERIMAACAATLKYFAVDAADLIRLPLMPSVLEVEIKLSVGAHRRLPASFSSNISQIASSLPLVETITVVYVDPLHPGPEIEWPDEGPLPIFDPSFMDHTQLLHLRRVHCILRLQTIFGDISALFDRFVPAMESRMPGLRGTGILKCVYNSS